MKENFSCTLTGSQWWKPLIGYFVLLLALFIPFEFAIIRMSLPGAENPGSSLLFMLVMLILIIILEAAFSIIIYRIVYPSISIRNESFKFNGQIGPFIKLYLIGSLLSLITLGFYFPWFTKKLMDYITENTEFKGEKTFFLGKAGKLLKYYLLALWLPLIVWAILVIGIAGLAGVVAAFSTPLAIILGIIAGILYLFIFVIIIPFMYLAYKWQMDMQWKNIRITWKTEFWPSSLFLAGQVLLTIITVGIYFPAFYIKSYRYFIGKTVLETNGEEISRLGFKNDSGFGYIWGQTLLSMITMGIYLPWAYANCLRYFINNTYIEDKQSLLNQ